MMPSTTQPPLEKVDLCPWKGW